MSQPSVSRCVNEVVNALNQPAIFNNWVKFPGNLEELNTVRRSFFDKYNFPGIIGCIDCTHVAIFPPRIVDPNYPEHLYVNRKGYHSINVQLVCDSDLRILNVNARYPGSTNDAFIWGNSNLNTTLQQLHANGHTDYFLLGDSGYPLRTCLLTLLEEEPAEGSPEYRYNVAHKRIRSTIERCNGVLKTRFRCLLKHRVLHYSLQTACQIINACVVLHNLCIHYGIGEDLEDMENVVDDAPNYNEVGLDVVAQRVNPELAAGRRVRNRLIQTVFRN
ncbi:DDE superfamily endonuclease [Popillia japonica]|uniref:Putative nuclease HARBI1 n=1 Tax=Popillia japonica TaxID=7064 RepID=A0AAW1HVQ8_POPJA